MISLVIVLSVQVFSTSITIPLKSESKDPFIYLSNYMPLNPTRAFSSINQYYGKFYLGSPGQEINLVIDASVPWLLLYNNSRCTSTDVKYTSSNSSSFQVISQNYENNELPQNFSYVLAQEQLSVPELDVKSQSFIISSDEFFNDCSLNGVFGIGLDIKNSGFNSFIKNLKDQNDIKKLIFGIYLNAGSDKDSEFTIGDYDPLKYSVSDKQIIRVLPNSQNWTTVIHGIKATKYISFDAQAQLHIESFYTYGPFDIIAEVYDQISLKQKNCSFENSLFYCNLKNDGNSFDFDSLPDVLLDIDGSNYTLTPRAYCKMENNSCFLKILGFNQSFWIIGQALFEEYYSVYDMDNLQVFLYKNGFKGFTIFFILVCIAFAISIILALGYFIIKKNRPNQAGYLQIPLEPIK